ncbi:MAG: hypothetical protein KatS3mg110_0450 [Pirellulaceae bacterium]|nr:MAG: hypothetical protein KatS3mg110_0450 [Pirellulaceae bacterium]
MAVRAKCARPKAVRLSYLLLPVELLPLLLLPLRWALAEFPSNSTWQPDISVVLAKIDPVVFPEAHPAKQAVPAMCWEDVQRRLRLAAQRENTAWRSIRGVSDWETFRDQRIVALRKSLGSWPDMPRAPRFHVIGVVGKDGYQIRKLIYESRPDLWVTANLYVPVPERTSMPAILISHSHHAPKTQGELQDMGATWARAGCLVMVPDHVGHGERRQHPFRTADDYPEAFRVDRQDYYFRYVCGVQLAVAGESLMGWMVQDLMRGLDILLCQPGVDPPRVILLGAVAGGGDPAAVTAALDSRVQTVVPFNFGGPQPDYPIPENAEDEFYYFGVAYWESTRCLRLGARDGFAHWVIAAAVAPRRLVYAHEFSWDEQRDPVWPRLKQVYRWYQAEDRLAAVFGQGTLRGQPPASSHCTNIGPLHRSRIYPLFHRWFQMAVPDEYSSRTSAAELACLSDEALDRFRSLPLHQLALRMVSAQLEQDRLQRGQLSPIDRRRQLEELWRERLGRLEITDQPTPQLVQAALIGNLRVDKWVLETEPGIRIPLLLLFRAEPVAGEQDVVVMVAQQGKQSLLQQRAEVIGELVNAGLVVCLVDVRGTGETEVALGTRHWRGLATSLSATEWLLGETVLAAQVRDLRAVMRFLKTSAPIRTRAIAVWGDSTAPANGPDVRIAVPLDCQLPKQAEPTGALLALLAGAFEPDVTAIYAAGGLVSYRSLLEAPFIYVPHESLIPGAVVAGDLPELATLIAPRPLCIGRLTDGCNRLVDQVVVEQEWQPARDAYRDLKCSSNLRVTALDEAIQAVRWLAEQLRRGDREE